MIKVYLQPQPSRFPARGGVKEHLLQISYHLRQQRNIDLVDTPSEADILHVESAWPIPLYTTTNYVSPVYKPKKVVYVCHGGFLPSIIPTVENNLDRADRIISVAGWMIDKYFKPAHKEKTVVIPNGISTHDFEKLPSNNLETGFVFYAKEWLYSFDEFYELVLSRPDLRFITTVWRDQAVPFNVKFIGLQSREGIKSILSKAGCLLLTGSEVCPTMLLESWYLGIPVIAKNIDGSRELMSGKFDDCLYTDDLSAKIDYALSNRPTIAHKAKEEVTQNYLWADLIKKYVAVYEELL